MVAAVCRRSHEHFLLLRFLRQTGDKGLPGLALELERLRESAAVQLASAYADQKRRYVVPRRAAREAKDRTGG